MITRRSLLVTSLVAGALSSSGALATDRMRLVLIHGRSQQGLDPAKLRKAWIEALENELKASQLTIPSDLQIEFPYYGDALEEFVKQSKLPRASDIRARGDNRQDDFLAFQSEMANELALQSGVTEAEIDAEYGKNPKVRGPLNWEWVQAILRAIDKQGGGMSKSAIEDFTRDVYLYLTSQVVRETIDKIVLKSFDGTPTIVVGHSLGSVVAYNVLKRKQQMVPLLVTVGSPLGIRAVRTPLVPIGFPKGVTRWFNAYDPRDVVALNPLDSANFAVDPPIENYSGVNNSTSNRHGIAGYLGEKVVARRIFDALGA
jgi:hypothetical protein